MLMEEFTEFTELEEIRRTEKDLEERVALYEWRFQKLTNIKPVNFEAITQWVAKVVELEGEDAPYALCQVAVDYLFKKDQIICNIVRIIIEQTPNFPFKAFISAVLFAKNPTILEFVAVEFDTPLKDIEFVRLLILDLLGAPVTPYRADWTINFLIQKLCAQGVSYFEVLKAITGTKQFCDLDLKDYIGAERC